MKAALTPPRPACPSPPPQELIFERMSEQKPKQIPGSVVLTLRQKRHALFRRDGNDLAIELRISLKEALLGFERSLVHLDGHEFTVRSKQSKAGEPLVTRPGDTLVVKGEGMPLHNFPSEFGNLKATISVDFPTAVSTEQADALKALF
ncbi:HSP40/DnaJ peptide-binding protein [Pavlovales sp. CCMP2436]|nr:HSP40/DnaJ peptide-binding protein [Pavlovales sp. CCMP2436]|mmetsp:Transcript_41625/g.102739  ORF Transcript_41625/g.102739 Transcript_41625/m.102739 type:complete len:148 (+) Transcript_41625:396-839(+)